MKIEQVTEVLKSLRETIPVEVTLRLDPKLAHWAIEHALSEYNDPENFIIGLLETVMEGDEHDALSLYKRGAK